MTRLASFTLGLMLILAAAASAAPGDRDLGFGRDGLATFSLGDDSAYRPSVGVQSTGRVLTSATIDDGERFKEARCSR